MQEQKPEIKVPLIVAVFMIALVIFLIVMATVLGIQNKRRRETIEIYEEAIEIYEEYYALDEDMDFAYREWVEYYPHYTEKEYYLKYYQEKYLRYLKLKKIIGEIEK